jgi:hypothetical protein
LNALLSACGKAQISLLSGSATFDSFLDKITEVASVYNANFDCGDNSKITVPTFGDCVDEMVVSETINAMGSAIRSAQCCQEGSFSFYKDWWCQIGDGVTLSPVPCSANKLRAWVCCGVDSSCPKRVGTVLVNGVAKTKLWVEVKGGWSNYYPVDVNVNVARGDTIRIEILEEDYQVNYAATYPCSPGTSCPFYCNMNKVEMLR